jgi:hypothetical protein
MLVIGSYALKQYKPEIVPQDLDYMCIESELEEQIKYFSKMKDFTIHKRTLDYCHLECNGFNYEFYIAHGNNSTEQLMKYCNAINSTYDINADLNVLYAIKLSHRYLRNSPHFLKTRGHIRDMEALGANISDPVLQKILDLREKETYNYAHPVLNQAKDTFFQDEVGYIYDHDTIHEAIAVKDKPAYKNYMKDGADVMVDKDKFFSLQEETKLLGVYEETCVLALERCLIPFESKNIRPKDAFIAALIKVCTSITSGWFRAYAYENFYEVIRMYRNLGEDDFVQKYKKNFHMVKPYKE